MRRHWGTLGVVGACIATLLACSSFGGAPEPPAAGDDGAAPEAASPGDASQEAAQEAASLCVPSPLEPADAGVDANCEGTGAIVGLEASSRHCGRCFHDCLGAACTNGKCTVEALSMELGTTTVAAATATHLYYATTGSTSRLVRRRSFATGAIDDLANPTGVGYLKDVQIVGPTPAVYAILSDRGVLSVPVTGGGETTVVDDGNNNVVRLAADETNLYWIRYGNLLARAHADGTDAATNFVVHTETATRAATNLIADGSGLFFALRDTSDDAGVTTSIWKRGPGKLDSVTQRLPLVDAVVDFATDADFLYWSTPKGEIWRASKTTQDPAVLVARAAGPALWSKGLAVDDGYVYAAMTASALGGDLLMTLVQAPKCGGPTRVLAQDTILGGGLVAAGGYLYWGTGPSLQRIAK